MTRFKDFGAGAAVPREHLEFKLHEETFSCDPAVQGKVHLDLAAKATASGEDGAASAEIILDFFKSVMLDESYARFEVLLESKERIVSVETLGEIVGWLMEEYTNRPEGQPEAS